MNFYLTHQPLHLSEVQNILHDQRCGGEVLFVGNVRDFSKGKKVRALHFEAYEPMAIKELEKISDEIKKRWPVEKIILHHRLGKLEVGETAVIAGISSIHRQEAFEACAYLMNRLKQSVPIWKKEIFEDGEEWVSATP